RPRFLVESRHRLGVVIVDLGSCLEHGADAVLVALKIWYEDFDRTARNLLVNLANRFGENPGAEVGEVVTVDRCDHGVLQSHLRDRLRYSIGLGDVVFGWPAVGDGAICAIPRTDIAEDHEGGGAMLPPLTDVGTVRFLAHG